MDTGDADFTAEELRLEQQLEQALSELEAADAAVTALRAQLEIANDEVVESRLELSKLQDVAKNWQQATEEGRRELAERGKRLEEMLSSLPPDLLKELGEQFQAEEEAAGAEAAEAARRERDEAALTKQLEQAAKRISSAEAQVERLQEQVAAETSANAVCQEERAELERQLCVAERDREAQSKAHKDARASLQAVEEQLRQHEDAASDAAKRQQALSRQVVQLTGTRNGLRARVSSAATKEALATAEEIPTVHARPPSEARTLSLRLQWEVVGLREALRAADEEGLALQLALEAKGLDG